MTFIRQCAWCKKIVGTKVVPSDTAWPDKITHTICPSCSIAVMKDLAHIQLKYKRGNSMKRFTSLGV
jgi:hypothetical protein